MYVNEEVVSEEPPDLRLTCDLMNKILGKYRTGRVRYQIWFQGTG